MSEADLATVALSDPDRGLAASFVPGAGMVCCSLRHRGEELLAQNADLEAYAQRGKTMGIPLLYPWANRLADFQYAAAGSTVQVPHDESLVATDPNGLPIHGAIGGRMAYRVVHVAEGSSRRSSTGGSPTGSGSRCSRSATSSATGRGWRRGGWRSR